MFIERSSTMAVELDYRRAGDQMSTHAPPAPTTGPLERAASGERRAPTTAEPATAPQPLAFKRIVVFDSLRDAVGCTASA